MLVLHVDMALVCAITTVHVDALRELALLCVSTMSLDTCVRVCLCAWDVGERSGGAGLTLQQQQAAMAAEQRRAREAKAQRRRGRRQQQQHHHHQHHHQQQQQHHHQQPHHQQHQQQVQEAAAPLPGAAMRIQMLVELAGACLASVDELLDLSPVRLPLSFCLSYSVSHFASLPPRPPHLLCLICRFSFWF
eukprot:COSAG05_NODE_2165_length_3447_cov_8.954002_5_plen_191_part_00